MGETRTLKPCPFCGWLPRGEKSPVVANRYVITCRSRSCKVRPCVSAGWKAKAVEFWNRRDADTPENK